MRKSSRRTALHREAHHGGGGGSHPELASAVVLGLSRDHAGSLPAHPCGHGSTVAGQCRPRLGDPVTRALTDVSKAEHLDSAQKTFLYSYADIFKATAAGTRVLGSLHTYDDLHEDDELDSAVRTTRDGRAPSAGNGRMGHVSGRSGIRRCRRWCRSGR